MYAALNTEDRNLAAQTPITPNWFPHIGGGGGNHKLPW